MEQMYLIEILVDRVTIFASEEEKGPVNKNLIIKIQFGPNVQFIIKDGQLAVNNTTKETAIENDENGRKSWTKHFRVGKSYLFPSYPDTVLNLINKYPLEISVWNDDINEKEIFVGVGTMHWHTQFFHMVKETAVACKHHEPLSIKQLTPLMAECCCIQVGEIFFILRLSALGGMIVTHFQQLLKDPDAFNFKIDEAPSVYQCKRIEPDDPKYNMAGSIYEMTLGKGEEAIDKIQNKIEVCTELQSCGVAKEDKDRKCDESKGKDKEGNKKYPIDKIRMGDITGPCGNTNCALAHRMRIYLRNLNSYKKQVAGKTIEKGKVTGKVCGKCDCKDDRYHRGECSEEVKDMTVCSGCGGVTHTGETCEDKKKMLFGNEKIP